MEAAPSVPPVVLGWEEGIGKEALLGFPLTRTLESEFSPFGWFPLCGENPLGPVCWVSEVDLTMVQNAAWVRVSHAKRIVFEGPK